MKDLKYVTLFLHKYELQVKGYQNLLETLNWVSLLITYKTYEIGCPKDTQTPIWLTL